MALGAGSVTTAPNAGVFSLNGGTVAATKAASVVSVGVLGSERQITNVAAGVVSATSTDAVNGSQLFTVGTAVNTLGACTVAALGGGAKVAADGTVTAPSYTIAGNTYNDVGSALAAQGKLGVQYTADKAGNPTAAVDLASNPNLPAGTTQVALTGVAAGSTKAGSLDAVNGGQLNTGLSSVATTLGGGASYDPVTGTVLNPTYAIAGTKYTDVGSALGALANGGAKSKYFNANSALADSTATGTDSVAIGPLAASLAANGVSLGNGATATNANDVALGAGSVTTAPNAGTTAVYGGKAAGIALVASGTVSVGAAGAERQIQNVAAGVISKTSTDAINGSQLFSVQSGIDALGTSVASGLGGGSVYDPLTGKASASTYAVAGGSQNNVGAALAALDTAAQTQGSGFATALGGGAKVAADGTVTAPTFTVGAGKYSNVDAALAALQSGAPVQYSTSGAPTTANGLNPSQDMTLVGKAAGAVALHNVAAAALNATSTDAVNGSQLFAAADTTASALGGGAKLDPLTGKIVAPTYVIGSNSYNDVGSALNDLNSSVNGGKGIKYFHTNSVLADSTPTGTDSVAVGPLASALGASSVAIGNAAVANNANDVALGAGSVSAALSAGATDITGGTAAGIAKAASGTVSVGASGAERQIQNVAAGSLTATSTDAVNGSQLYSVASAGNTTGSSVASALGGGATYTAGKGVSAPSYSVGSSTFSNVGSALTALQAGAPVQFSTSALPTTPNGFVPSQNMTLVGKAAGPVTLSNVAAGALTATSTDAVNGSQLYATNLNVSNLSKQVAGGIAYDNTAGAANPTAAGPDALAVGPGASASGSKSAALGNSSTASGPSSTAVGNGATSSGNNSVALGAGSNDGGRANTVSVGTAGAERTLSNVAAGTLPTDAVNVSQLSTTVAALGGGATIDPVTGKVTGPSYVIGSSTYTDVGSALGSLDKAVNGGGGIKYFHTNSKLGDSTPTGTDSVAIGPVASALATNGVAIGNGATATNANDVALGAGSVTAAANTGAFDLTGGTAAATKAASTVSVGVAGAERQVQNVAAGVLSATSTDAVNGSQLFSVASAVNNTGSSVATALGGGMVINPDGTTKTAPSYTVGGTTVNNVGAAVAALQSQSPVQYSTSGAPTTANGLNQSQDMTLVGKAAGPVALHNVAAGALNGTSTDAVNGSQLNTTNTQLAALNHSAVQYATDGAGNTQSTISLASDAGGPVIIHNLAAGVANTDAANVGQVNAVAKVANNSVQYDAGPGGTKANTITLSGGTAAPVVLQNVGAGVNPTDAVNYSQLSATNTNVSNLATYTQNAVNKLQTQISSNAKAANAGTANALAAAGLRYGDRPGKTSVAGAMGVYHGQVGVALGFGHTSENDKWRFNGAVTFTPTMTKPDFGVVVGASYVFD